MIIEFYLKSNKLYKQDQEQTINQNATDTKLAFDLKDEWEEYRPYCLVKTKEFVYRLELHKNKEDADDKKIYCDLPDEASSFAFIKLSLYGVGKEDRVTSNELIIPINRGGYLEYKPHRHHDHFIHHGKHHYHHDFPHYYPVRKTHKNPRYDVPKDHHHHHHGEDKPRIEIKPMVPPKPPFDWDKKDKEHIYNDISHPKEHPRYKMMGDSVWDEKYVDVFDYVLHEIKDSINNIVIDKDKCYAYHNKRLLQVIPLPDYVTREELDYFLGDLVSDINFFENGDVIITKGAFRE